MSASSQESPDDLPAVPPELAEAGSTGHLAILFGAGASRGSFDQLRELGRQDLAPLGSWSGMLELLCDSAGRAFPDRVKRIEGARAEPNDVLRASRLRRATGDDWLRAQIVRLFKEAEAAGVKPSPLHDALADLPGAAFLTTNYDHLMEDAWRARGRPPLPVLDASRPEDVAALRDGTLLKLHGDLERPETIVLTVKDFNRMGHGIVPAWKEKLKAYAQPPNQLVLVGYSYSDPDLQEVLNALAGAYAGQIPGPYWLQGRSDGAEAKAEDYGLRPLWVSKDDVVRWLRRLQQEIERRQAGDLPPPLRAHFDLLHGEVERFVDDELRRAAEDFSGWRLVEAADRFAALAARMGALLNEGGADRGALRGKWARSLLGLGLCQLCRQQIGPAREALLSAAAHADTLRPSQIGMLAFSLAQLGEFERAEALVADAEALDPDAAEVRGARQMIAIQRGLDPQEPLLDPYLNLLWCRRLIEQGQVAPAVKRTMAVLQDVSDDHINTGTAVDLLRMALFRSVISTNKLPAPIPVKQRPAIVTAIEVNLERLLGLVQTDTPSMPDFLRADLLRSALSFYQLTYDQARIDWCREELHRLGHAPPDDVAQAQRLAEQGRVGEALVALPGAGPPWFRELQQIDIRWLGGLRDQALCEAQVLAADHPDQPQVLHRVADILLRSRRAADALGYAERACTALPCRVHRFVLAQCLAGCGRSAEAWRALEAVPPSPSALAGHRQELAILRLRALLAEGANLPRAPKLLREYLAHDPPDGASLYLHLAGSLHRLGASQEEVARAAWAAIERDRQQPGLSASALYDAARMQRGTGPLDDVARDRIRTIVGLLKARFPQDLDAAQYRVELRLAHALGEDVDDWELLVRAGRFRAVPVEEFLDHRKTQGEFNLTAERAYRTGEISFEALCALTGADASVYLSQLLRFHRDGTPTYFLCPPIGMGLRRGPASWKGLRLLTGQLELLLLVHLRLLDRLGEVLGPDGQILVFQDVLDQIEGAEQRLLSAAQPDLLAQEESLWRTLLGLSQAGRMVVRLAVGRPNISDEIRAAQERAAVLQMEPPASGAAWLSPQSVLSALLEAGRLEQARVERLRHRLPAGEGPRPPASLPGQCYVSADVLRAFFAEGALDELARHLPGKLVAGPEAAWSLLSMQADLREKQEAGRLASDLRRAAGAWRAVDRLRPIPRPEVPALPLARSSGWDQAVRRPLYLAFSYAQALDREDQGGRELWLLSADLLREMPLVGHSMRGQVGALLSTDDPRLRRTRMEGLLALSRRAQQQTLTLPDLLRETGPDEAALTEGQDPRQAPRGELLRLGFTDAATAADIIGLAEAFGTLDQGQPAWALDCIEWRAREPTHPARQFVGLHLAQVYAEAIWEAFCGDRGLHDRRERVLRGLLQRVAILDREDPIGMLDALLRFVVTRSVTRFQKAFVSAPDGEHLVSAEDAPASQLYQALAGWAGWDGPRRAAYGRAVRHGWLFLDGFAEESGQAGEPEERFVAPLLAAARALQSHEAREALLTPERESLAILSALWDWKPLHRDGLQVQEVRPDGTSREADTFLLETLLERGVSLLSHPPPLPIEADDGVWSYMVPVAGRDGELQVRVAAEALLLRASDEVVSGLAPELAADLRPHDGHAYHLLRTLAERPGDRALRRAVARHAAVAPWRLCREDPMVYGTLGQRIPGLADVYPEDEAQLRELLSEPPGPLPDAPLRQILNLRRQGPWGEGQDAGALLWQASQVPGNLPAMTLGLRFAARDIDRDDVDPRALEHYEEQVANVLERLERPHEQPAAMLAGDIYFLRTAAAIRPLVHVAQGQVDLRTLVPECFLRVLKAVRAQPHRLGQGTDLPESAQPAHAEAPIADSLADAEASLLRLCRRQVQALHARAPRDVSREDLVESAMRSQDLTPRETLWLTYRLFQWLLAQLDALPPDARQAGLSALARLAPPPLPMERCLPDLLDPARFARERVDHRLATVLCALSHMESISFSLAQDDDRRMEGHLRRVSSGAIEDVLLELSRRPLSPDERAPAWPVARPSTLDWEGPGTIPELALLALLRMRAAALTQLSIEERLGWFRRLPPATSPDGPIHPALEGALVASAAESARALTSEERRMIKVHVRARLAAKPAEADQLLWPVLAQLYGAGEADLGEEVRAHVLDVIKNSHPIAVCGYYLAGLSWAAPERLEAEAHALLQEAGSEALKVTVAHELARVVFIGNPEVETRARALLQQLGRDAPYNADREMRKLLSFLGLT